MNKHSHSLPHTMWQALTKWNIRRITPCMDACIKHVFGGAYNCCVHRWASAGMRLRPTWWHERRTQRTSWQGRWSEKNHWDRSLTCMLRVISLCTVGVCTYICVYVCLYSCTPECVSWMCMHQFLMSYTTAQTYAKKPWHKKSQLSPVFD